MNFSNKHGQVKFGETFAIIIIVYIVIVVGMVWYNKVNTTNINEMKQEDALNKAFEKYNFMLNSQFLHFSQQSDVDEEFDLESIKIFNTYSKNGKGREFIRKQLGEATITINVFDKTSTHGFNSNHKYLLYNNTPNDDKQISDGKTKRFIQNTFRTLIPVVDSIEKQTKLGILEVTVYD